MIARTKLADRKLPRYTRGEEIFNMVSHIVGAALGVAALVLCVVVSALKGSAIAVVSSSIYGASLVMLYTMSSVYHGLRCEMGKKVMQVIDHCTIYFLIAGTYTPILLCGIMRVDKVAAWVIFGVVWGFAALATTLTAIDLKNYQKFSMICYIGMGWCIVLAAKATMEALSMPGIVLLLTGGVAYTVGAVLYGAGKKHRYMHSVFHLFCLGGSVGHIIAIWMIL